MQSLKVASIALLILATLTTSTISQTWLPTEKDTQKVLRLTHEYFSLRDDGHYDDAYSMMAPSTKRVVPLWGYKERVSTFNNIAGSVVEHRIVEVTWSKDPLQAPFPGVYAAVDVVSKFQNIDRHCGYLVFHQQPDGQFLIMREEENHMDHATERSIREDSSQEEVEKMWAQLAQNCP